MSEEAGKKKIVDALTELYLEEGFSQAAAGDMAEEKTNDVLEALVNTPPKKQNEPT